MIHLVVEKTIDVVVLLYITPLTNYKKKILLFINTNITMLTKSW